MMMGRSLAELTDNQFDILVLGGGIHGVFVAWDAALRGLRVALIDKGDFGNATSQNSLKIIHGGLRYIQDGNISIVRNMVQERSCWMKIAPHLVHPLPCLLPTNNSLTRNRFVINLALQINNLLSYDRNRLLHPQQSIPDGRWISREECNQLIPGINSAGMTGAAMWYDAQIYNTERLVMSVIMSASRAGAVVANYLEATGFIQKGSTISGVKARDVFSGQDLEIRTSMVVNCAGAWVDSVLRDIVEERNTPIFNPSVALNLVTHQIWEKYAIGVSSQPQHIKNNSSPNSTSQVFFIVPWKQYSIIGTWHLPLQNHPKDFEPTEEIVQHFLDAVNSIDQDLHLSLDEVLQVHYGFLPKIPQREHTQKVRLVREGKVIDHQREDGITGLITVLGVKYTTARLMAEKAVDMVLNKLDHDFIPCQTNELPLYGGDIGSFNDFFARETYEQGDNLDLNVLKHLINNHGSEYKNILDYLDRDMTLAEQVCKGSPVVKAEIIHAVRQEMAQTLLDVILRRTELGSAGIPERACVERCAKIMGAELGWDENRQKREIENVIDFSPNFLSRATY
jgi:glycerol-3-phosphate dehydrogenase